LADDPALMAELLLLVRMSFADGHVAAEEAQAFKSICVKALGLKEDDLGDILHYINDFGYETSNEQAAAVIAQLPQARKHALLSHLAEIARADGDIDPREKALMTATINRLRQG